MKIALLTGNVDPHYQLDLLKGLVLQGIEVDFIGSDSMENASIIENSKVHFYNLRPRRHIWIVSCLPQPGRQWFLQALRF